MPATDLPLPSRYFRPGKTHVLLLPAVTSMTPTRAQINAGDDATAAIAAVSGFTVDGAKIDTPDWGSRIVGNVPGRITFADSSITWYADDSGADIRAELALDQEVFVLFMDQGDVATKKMDVYQCDVLSVSSTKDGDNAAQVVVNFSVNDYADQVTIPAV